MPESLPHIIIIGGGVIGTSIAWHLTEHHAKVTLIEAGDLASGSSGACDGLVFMQSKKPGIHLELAMESLKKFDALQKTLPFDIEFKQTGGLVVIESDTEYPAMEKYLVIRNKDLFYPGMGKQPCMFLFCCHGKAKGQIDRVDLGIQR